MQRLSLLDSSFLIGESRETPMHTGGVSLYQYPKGVNKREFLSSLRAILLAGTDLRPRFNQRLSSDMLSKANVAFSWEDDRELDIEYHIRHSALPQPGRYRELFALVSRLHGSLLDRNRPLWEFHLIEGLAENQFATYLKTHHSMLDGVAAMYMTSSMLSPTRAGRVDYSPLSREAWEHYKKQVPVAEPGGEIRRADLKSLGDRLASQLGAGKNLAGALLKYANVWLGGDSGLSVPWHNVPSSIISSNVTGSRRFVALLTIACIALGSAVLIVVEGIVAGQDRRVADELEQPRAEDGDRVALGAILLLAKVVGADHQHDNLRFHLVQFAIFDAPKDVLGAITADAEVQRVTRGVELLPDLQPPGAPPIRDGIAKEHQVARPLLRLGEERFMP